MRTINEVVRDVLANPEAYIDAFPVSAPEVLVAFDIETHGVRWSTFSDLNAPGVDLSGARLSPEAMELARQRMLRDAVHAYWTDGNTRFVQDESHPRDRVTMVSMPLREDSAFQRMVNRERERRGFIRRTWESGRRPTTWEDEAREWAQHMINMTAIDDPSMGTADQPAIPYYGEGVEQAARRPDHYRVSSGRCVCGFTSMFAGDMENHLAGPAIGQFGREWWMVCECGASALCREVGVARNQPISWSQLPFDPNRASGPTIDRIYLCDTCRQRRGIR